MHEINVSVASPEAADYGVAQLTAGGESIGYTILEDGDLMLHIEPRRDHAAVVVGARSLAQALIQACHLLEEKWRAADATQLPMQGRTVGHAPADDLTHGLEVSEDTVDDPTRGTGSEPAPSEDPMQGREGGEARYDDPMQGREVGSDRSEHPTEAR